MNLIKSRRKKPGISQACGFCNTTQQIWLYYLNVPSLLNKNKWVCGTCYTQITSVIAHTNIQTEHDDFFYENEECEL
ncbi:MAG: hypothetical protein ACXACY_28730 [Candidatus Hodarchaeales archaeon]|jgi:hypothetical protein